MEDSNFDNLLYDIIVSVIPQFDYYGENIVTRKQWKAIKDKSLSIGGKRKEVIEEVDAWVTETFKNHDHFSILGL